MSKTKTAIEIPDFLTVRELANLMQVSPIDVIKELMRNGIMANINQQIDFDTAAIVAEEMGFQPQSAAPPEAEEVEVDEDRPAWRQILAREHERDLIPRPPVVTMLGHVDHGKTSLLDVIRRSNVTASEAGGITQHIGAYQVTHNGQLITFLDTPGHEAFTAMRARGARATDIAILVVAADDGVMPQTREALDHARAAHVPIVVALNKVDLPQANPPRVKQQLSELGLVPDDWNGDTLVIPVSARTKAGISDLLEAIVLTADEIRPRANPKADASGVVLEARMDRGHGMVATVLVQNGTLKTGDTVMSGVYAGRIKAMFDFNGKAVKKAGPSAPVSIAGLNGLPAAGERFQVVENEKEARRLIAEHEERQIVVQKERRGPSLDDFFSRMQAGEVHTLNLIVKADVQGSLEPIVQSLNKIQHDDEVKLEILRYATGDITENDVMLAVASKAVILGFHAEVDAAARLLAKSEGVQIKTYKIIYELIEDVKRALKGLLGPVYEDVVIGRAEVRQVFRIRSVGNIAGSYMRTGVAQRNARVRVIRHSRLMAEGPVSSLKHLQDNVREVRAGFEFGVSIDNFEDFEPGDILEFVVQRQVSS